MHNTFTQKIELNEDSTQGLVQQNKSRKNNRVASSILLDNISVLE